jgi:FtsH-binding integral membrane protein
LTETEQEICAMAEVLSHRFVPRTPSDRDFFLLILVAIWGGVAAGFIPDSLEHFNGHHVAYAPIVHVHAVSYVAWLGLLTTQMSLIRADRSDLHRRLGLVSLFMIPWMAIIGPWTGLVMQRAEFGTPDGNPPFMILQVLSMLCFVVLSGAALAKRRDAAFHKRLMLMGTIVLADAGFGRWIGPYLGPFIAMNFGGGPLAFHVPHFIGSDLLILAILGYDLVTRRRVKPLVLGAAVFVLITQLATTAIYGLPAWQALATHLVGH